MLDTSQLWNPRLGRDYVRQTRLADNDTSDLIRDFLSRSRYWQAVNMHRELQDALADELITADLEPLSPRLEDPQFDLAFRHGHELVVVEVKSLPRGGEERQLRDGFGQLTKYAEQLRLTGESVRPVLYVERDPGDPVWESLCARHGIVLAWPETRERIWSPNMSNNAPAVAAFGRRFARS